MKTRQQVRAAFAMKALEAKVSKNEITKELANFIVGMPNMILSNGLGQTMAFLLAKSSKPERKFVFYTIKKYLCQTYSGVFEQYKEDDANDNFSFLKKFNEDQSNYIKMQNEVLRMLEWLKRYARAFEIEDSKNGKSE